MTTATSPKATTFKSAILGTVVLHTYVDPFPGKKGNDRVYAPCGRCGGTGRTVFTWVEGGRCFQCGGNGAGSQAVSTARRNARVEAFRTEYAQELRAARDEEDRQAAIAAAAAEFAAAWDEAHAEAARRAALVQGFVGNVGDKVTNLVGTVNVAKYIAAKSYGWSASMFVTITLDSGQVIKTFGSSETLFALNRGDRVTLGGKVKGHEQYNGQDQTVLSHVKVVVMTPEEPQEAPAPVEAPIAPAPAAAPAQGRTADVLAYFGVGA